MARVIIHGLKPDGTLTLDTSSPERRTEAANIIQAAYEARMGYAPSLKAEDRRRIEATLESASSDLLNEITLEAFLERLSWFGWNTHLAHAIRSSIADQAELLAHPYLAAPTDKTRSIHITRTVHSPAARRTQAVAFVFSCVMGTTAAVFAQQPFEQTGWAIVAVIVAIASLLVALANGSRTEHITNERVNTPAELEEQRAAARDMVAWLESIVANAPAPWFGTGRISATPYTVRAFPNGVGSIELELRTPVGNESVRVAVGDYYRNHDVATATPIISRLIADALATYVKDLKRDLLIV